MCALTRLAVDIINVVSVTEPAIVKHWFEENDEETQDSLYWRQAYDVRSQELSVCAITFTLPVSCIDADKNPVIDRRTRMRLQHPSEP